MITTVDSPHGKPTRAASELPYENRIWPLMPQATESPRVNPAGVLHYSTPTIVCNTAEASELNSTAVHASASLPKL